MDFIKTVKHCATVWFKMCYTNEIVVIITHDGLCHCDVKVKKKYQQHKNSSEATLAAAACVCQISRAPTSNHNKIQKGEYGVCKGKQSTGMNCFLQQTGRFSMLDPKQRRAAS